MILDPDDVNVRSATFGRIVEDFKASPIGSYIYDRAIREGMDAVEALKEADAGKPEDIRNLQLKARVADRILTWLEEAIAEGHSALETIREEEYGG